MKTIEVLGIALHNCIPSYEGSRDRKLLVQDLPWAKAGDAT
jgi:hypothetical protein